MIDRLSKKYITLPDGRTALRYGDYDANGNLLGYKYLAPEDEPIEPGTIINKATLFTDATAAAYDLSGSDATPNNALGALAFASQYTWARQRKPTTEYFLYKGAVSAKVVTLTANTTTQATIYWTESITVNANGDAIAGVSGSQVVSYGLFSYANNLKGKYWSRHWQFTQGAVINPMYFKDTYEINYTEPNAPNATQGTSGSPVNYYVYLQSARVTPSSIITTYEPEVLSSTDPDAYPHSDTSDYSYRFFNRFSDLPLAFMEPSAVTGTYTGDGAATRDIPLSGTFSAIFVSYAYAAAQALSTQVFSFATQQTPGWAVTLTPSGFTVYNSGTGVANKATNQNATQFFFIAWR